MIYQFCFILLFLRTNADLLWWNRNRNNDLIPGVSVGKRFHPNWIIHFRVFQRESVTRDYSLLNPRSPCPTAVLKIPKSLNFLYGRNLTSTVQVIWYSLNLRKYILQCAKNILYFHQVGKFSVSFTDIRKEFERISLNIGATYYVFDILYIIYTS